MYESLPACMYVNHTDAWCLWRTEGCLGCLELEIAGCELLVVAGNGICILCKNSELGEPRGLSTVELSLQPHCSQLF